MKRIVTILVALLLVGGLVVGDLLAESHQIEILRAVQIAGAKLEPGKYKLTLNGDNTVEFHRGRRLVVKAQVETAPLAGATPNSISQSREGQLLEIRLSNQKVRFVESAAASKGAR